jgi:hypothetical protein
MSDATSPPRGRRINIWVTPGLLEAAREVNPDLNVSALVQEALREVIGCSHEELACRKCSAPIVRADVVEKAVTSFYLDALDAIGELVRRGGTAEGAARKLREIAGRWRLKIATEAPLPRPTRAERHTAKVKEMPDRRGEGGAHARAISSAPDATEVG